MSFSFVDSLPPKVGLKQGIDQSSSSKIQKTILHQLAPLPISRRNILNSTKIRERFQLKGDKFMTKLSVAGPDTFRILQGIKKSCCIKSVQYFEFDPYLCEYSNITYLRTICHKIKGTKRLNLVIRR